MSCEKKGDTLKELMMSREKKGDTLFACWLIVIGLAFFGWLAFYGFYWSPHQQFEQAFGRPWVNAKSASDDERLLVVTRLFDLCQTWKAGIGEVEQQREASLPKQDSPEKIIQGLKIEQATRQFEERCDRHQKEFRRACEAAKSAGFTAEARACGCRLLPDGSIF